MCPARDGSLPPTTDRSPRVPGPRPAIDPPTPHLGEPTGSGPDPTAPSPDQGGPSDLSGPRAGTPVIPASPAVPVSPSVPISPVNPVTSVTSVTSVTLDLGLLRPGTRRREPRLRRPGTRIARTTARPGTRMAGPTVRRAARWSMRSAARLAVPVATVAGLGLALTVVLAVGAGIEVRREHAHVTAELVAARAAAARVPGDLGRNDLPALGADLERLARSGRTADALTHGWTWTVAAHLSPDRSNTTALRMDSHRLAELARAAGPLAGSVRGLDPANGHPTRLTRTDGRPATRGAETAPPPDLAGLARDLARYSAAATATAHPSAPAAARAELAGGLLPGLSGASGVRTWSVCRGATGPCVRARISRGRVTLLTAAPSPATPPGHDRSAGPDLLVVGVDPRSLFDRLGTWDARAVLGLLYRLGPGVGMRSADAVEQGAIDRLSASASRGK
jgi:hypothetical protein